MARRQLMGSERFGGRRQKRTSTSLDVERREVGLAEGVGGNVVVAPLSFYGDLTSTIAPSTAVSSTPSTMDDVFSVASIDLIDTATSLHQHHGRGCPK
ncbi:hypothetical protein PIB30_051719 [Stylosanthes scabra]|uniref:Uncharacterized protein n=1 Tax=Stylosanthes scabra TaxID=79078 RepID=A0ABU6QIQ4_9FABA|nr:hypothetical protein [Stylosanthes scabra]